MKTEYSLLNSHKFSLLSKLIIEFADFKYQINVTK